VVDGLKWTLDCDFNEVPVGFPGKLDVSVHLPAFDKRVGHGHWFSLVQHSCCTLGLAEFMRVCQAGAVKLIFSVLIKELICFADVFFFNKLAGKGGFTTAENTILRQNRGQKFILSAALTVKDSC